MPSTLVWPKGLLKKFFFIIFYAQVNVNRRATVGPKRKSNQRDTDLELFA